MNRNVAIQNGDRTYHGRPCKYGHIGIRYSSSANCVECKQIQNLHIIRPTSKKKHDIKYRNSLLGRARRNEYEMTRRATRAQRTPKWLTPDDHEAIRMIYVKKQQLQQKSGIKYSVDHIIPLRGKYVSGLHVPENLQIMKLKENIRKGNKYPQQGHDPFRHVGCAT